jgi:hypothetical protein
MNTALMTSTSGMSFDEARRDREFWGRLMESAVGAHLANAAAAGDVELHYWRDRNREVDFVLRRGSRLVAIEVKSGRAREMPAGIAAFQNPFGPERVLRVGGDGLALEEFLMRPQSDVWMV